MQIRSTVVCVVLALLGVATAQQYCAPTQFSASYLMLTDAWAVRGNLTICWDTIRLAMYQNGITAAGEPIDHTLVQKGKLGWWFQKNGPCYTFNDTSPFPEQCQTIMGSSPANAGGAAGTYREGFDQSTGSYSAYLSGPTSIIAYANFTVDKTAPTGNPISVIYMNATKTAPNSAFNVPNNCHPSTREAYMAVLARFGADHHAVAMRSA